MNLMSKIYNNNEFMSVASPILSHEEFVKTKSIVHHGNTRYNHSVRVAYISYKLSKLLNADKNACIKAGVLHDFFLVRDDKNIVSSAKMLVNHPTLAKENAIKYFNVNEKEQNIIESHMFPISSVTPKTKEAWLVSISDKLVALMEGASSFKTQFGIWMLFMVNILK